jgi:di/tricarboxylate transporter
MKSTIKLFLILITLTVIVVAWITQQLGNPRIQILILVLLAATLATFFIINMMEHREDLKRNNRLKSSSGERVKPINGKHQRSTVSLASKERKSGLTWGGGNIKASEAKRGTRRKFLGK